MPRIPTQPTCDRDCFHCPYPDCIRDDISPEERTQLQALDQTLSEKRKKKLSPEAQARAREKSLQYYYDHKAERQAYNKAWRQRNRERHREASLRWEKENPDRVRAIQRRGYIKRMANETPEQREKRLAYQAAYRAAKRKEKAAALSD